MIGDIDSERSNLVCSVCNTDAILLLM